VRLHIINWNEHYLGTVNHHLAFFFKVDRDTPANVGLDLPNPPLRCLRVADQLAGLKQCIHF